MRLQTLLLIAIILSWSGIFSGNCMANPVIDSVSPTTAATGHEIHIYGQQFGHSQGDSSVTFFDGISADHIVSWTDTEIVCQVPDGAHSGCLTVSTSESTSSCFNINVLNLGDFHILSGTISGIPVVPDAWIEIRIQAIETSGANLGNEMIVPENGSYQLALFPGTYDLQVHIRIDKWVSESDQNYLGVWNYTIERDIVISDDTDFDIFVPIYVLSGRVTDESGAGVPGVRLETDLYNDPYSIVAYTYSLDEPGSEGAFTMYLLPETYESTINPPPHLFPTFAIEKLHILGDTERDIVLSTDYSILNDAIGALEADLELHYDHFDVIDQDQSLEYDIPMTASRDEMDIIVNWGGSEVLVEIIDPDGGVYDAVQSQTPPIVINIPYPAIGTWSCHVTAIDVPYENYPIGLAAGITPNEMPVADPNGPYTGNVGDDITLDASGSYDQDGSIVLYEWDLDNDGIFEIRTSYLSISHTWESPYAGSIALRVTDDEGETTTEYTLVEILPSGCFCDVEPDGDLDGVDLAAFAQAFGVSYVDSDLNEFVRNFGLRDCIK